jgi:hypothetical protein
MDFSSESNEFYLKFLIQSSSDCFNSCVKKDDLISKDEKLSITETDCVKSCFIKYYLAYESVSDIVGVQK